MGSNSNRAHPFHTTYDYNYGQLNSSGSIIAGSNNGQLATIESHIGANKQWTKKFSYDAIGRLSKEEEYRGDNSALVYRNQYDYDRFGNLYRKQSNNANSLSANWIEETDISKATNRFTTGTQYDNAGNVVQDTKFRNSNFSYDANGRMYKTTRTDNIPNQASSVYDASGMRVAQQVDDVWTFFIYDAFGKMVAEYGGLQGTDEGGVKYLLSDWQGSTRAITGNTGVVQARMDYTAFGEEISSGVGQRTTQQGFGASNNFRNKYALTERDQATGLDHTWFRKNESRAGRWTSPDPYNGSMSLGNPQSFNRYSYVENQPTNFVDPSGLLMSPGVCITLAHGTRYTFADGKVIDIIKSTSTICFGGGSSNSGGGGFGSGGGGGQQNQPKIDDQKLKDCTKDLFKVETTNYEIGKSFNGKADYYDYFLGSLVQAIDSLFGVDRSLISVTTSQYNSSRIRYESGSVFNPVASGKPIFGYTEPDGKTNMIVNDMGTPAFQNSLWIYELGNALGIQTGNQPKAVDEERRYGNQGANDKGGPALVDCVFGGKVNSDGGLSPVPRPQILQ
jgi:RHS repeat-associated protein